MFKPAPDLSASPQTSTDATIVLRGYVERVFLEMKAFLLLVAVVLIGCGENNVTENPNVDDSDRGATMKTGEAIEESSGAETNNAAEDK